MSDRPSRPMDYGSWPDAEARRFARLVAREKRELARTHQPPFWQRLISHVLIPTLAVLVIGEAALYVHGHMPLTLPIGHGVTTTAPPHPATHRSHQ